MENRLQGKVAIVTGASRGIGRVVALTFAREGAKVVVAAKSESARPTLPGSIHTVVEEITQAGGEAIAVRCDVREDAEVAAMVETAVARFGRIDILVNNAGALWWQNLIDTPIKRFDLMMDVNARASFYATQLCLPHMFAAGGGHVIVCSPPIDLSALPGKVGYLISKFGMTMIALGVAEEVRDRNVAVNALWPVTAIESQATINFGLGGPSMWRKPEILADAMLEMVTTPPKELTGQALLDEDFLRERGVTDFTKYRCDPAHEPPRILAKDLPKAGALWGKG